MSVTLLSSVRPGTKPENRMPVSKFAHVEANARKDRISTIVSLAFGFGGVRSSFGERNRPLGPEAHVMRFAVRLVDRSKTCCASRNLEKKTATVGVQPFLDYSIHFDRRETFDLTRHPWLPVLLPIPMGWMLAHDNDR